MTRLSNTGAINGVKKNRRWPVKADYKTISRADAVALVTEFGELYGLDSLRAHSNFAHLTFSRAEHFDNWDLREAIDYALHRLADRSFSDDGQKRLWARLEAYCGTLDQPVALMIAGWPLVFPRGAALS